MQTLWRVLHRGPNPKYSSKILSDKTPMSEGFEIKDPGSYLRKYGKNICKYSANRYPLTYLSKQYNVTFD